MSAATDPIKHIVVLMLENRSFDHMLGSMKSFHPGIDGIDPAKPFTNTDAHGNPYPQSPDALLKLSRGFDPDHGHLAVMEQIDQPSPCGGFVRNLLKRYPDNSAGARQVMAYFDRQGANRLRVLHALAEQYLIADRWHCSVPGPTWPNRFFMHSGTANGYVNMGSPLAYWKKFDQVTIYDRLHEAHIPWRIYFSDVPQAFMLRQLRHRPLINGFHPLQRFFADAAGAEGAFPAYSFIEPRYFLPYRTDQHPPHHVAHGEGLIQQVYQALVHNPALWASTLLIVLYDEHGGFCDHVHPGSATRPDDLAHDGFNFDRFGVRVPALLISPHVRPGFTNTLFDHTSILKYVTEKWQLGPLGARVAAANSLAPLIAATPQPPAKALRALPTETLSGAAWPQVEPEEQPEELDDLQQALLEMTAALEQEIAEPISFKGMRAARATAGPQDAAQVARERVQRFLAQEQG